MKFFLLSCLLLAASASAKFNPGAKVEQIPISTEAGEDSGSSSSSASSLSSASATSSSSGPRPITKAQIDEALNSIKQGNFQSSGNQGQQTFSQSFSQSFKPSSSFSSSSNFGSSNGGYSGQTIQGAVQNTGRRVEFVPYQLGPQAPARNFEVGPNNSPLNLFFNSRSNNAFDVFSQKPYAGRPETTAFYSTTQQKTLSPIQSIQNPTMVREYAQFFRPVSYTTQVVGPVREQVHTVVATSTGARQQQQQLQQQQEGVQGQEAQQAQQFQTNFQTFKPAQFGQAHFVSQTGLNSNSNNNNNGFGLGQQIQSSFVQSSSSSENQIVTPNFPAIQIPSPKPLTAYQNVKVHTTKKSPWEAAREILADAKIQNTGINLGVSNIQVQSKPVSFVKPQVSSQSSFTSSSTSSSSGGNQNFLSKYGNSQQSSSSASSTSSFSPSIQQVLSKFSRPQQQQQTSSFISNVQSQVGPVHVIQSPRPGPSPITRVDYEIPFQQQAQPIQSVPVQSVQTFPIPQAYPGQQQHFLQQRVHLPVQTTRLNQFQSFPLQVPTNRFAIQQQVQPFPAFPTVVQPQFVQPTVYQQQQFPTFKTERTVQVRPLVTESTIVTPNTVKTAEYKVVQQTSLTQPQNIQSLGQNQNSYLLNQIGSQQKVVTQPAQQLTLPSPPVTSVNVQTQSFKVVQPGTTTTVDQTYSSSQTSEESEESSSSSSTSISYGTNNNQAGSVQSVPTIPSVPSVPVVAPTILDESLDVTGNNAVDSVVADTSSATGENQSKLQSSVEYAVDQAPVSPHIPHTHVAPLSPVAPNAPIVALSPVAPIAPVEYAVDKAPVAPHIPHTHVAPVAPVESPVEESVSSSSTSEDRSEESEETSSSSSSSSNTYSQPAAQLGLDKNQEQISQVYLNSEDDVDSSKKKKK